MNYQITILSILFLKNYILSILIDIWHINIQDLFGRSWTKIAQLIPSRTTLQVKNYAQQFFKQQVSSYKINYSYVI